MSTGPSQHLSWKELACKDGTPYPEQWKLTRAYKLAHAFEKIRTKCGNKPIEVLSAYRTVKHNKSIGGARFSQHLEGRALDIKPPKGITVQELANIVRVLAYDLDIKGIGIYPTFVHIDIRPAAKLSVWRSDGLKDSIT